MALPNFKPFWAAGHFEVAPPADGAVMFSDFRRDPARFQLSAASCRIEIFSWATAAFGCADCPGELTWLPPEQWLGSKSLA